VLEGKRMNIIGTCGDNCNYCPRYINKKNGNIQALEKVKELWVRLGLRDPDFPAKDMACKGCMPDNKCAYMELCTCKNLKSLKNCGLCKEYPCKLIEKAFDNSDKLHSRAAKVCSQKEMDMLQKAFFSKKEYFDHIHQKYLKKVEN
jgi:hypothetical protein